MVTVVTGKETVNNWLSTFRINYLFGKPLAFKD